MAKNVYNFDLFTTRKQQLLDIRRRQTRRRRAKALLLTVVIAFAAVVLIFINNSTSTCYSYKKETATEDTGDISYEPFGSGYLKYSKDGVEYQKHFGTAVWNYPLSFSDPFLAASSGYALLADKGSNVLHLYDKDGLVQDYTMRYPVVQAGVSDQGLIEVVLEGGDSNYIQVYDAEGELVADLKATMEETGYPLATAISPDGSRLVVAYYTIQGMRERTDIVFYDLSRPLQDNGETEEDLSLDGGFNYEDRIIPKMTFLSDSTMIAVGDGEIYYYRVSGTPSQLRKITCSQEIESVFMGENTLGLVLDNSENPDEGACLIQLYNRNGARTLSKAISMNYDTIRMWGRQIIAIHENECTILKDNGILIFQGELEGDAIEEIFPRTGWRCYYVVFKDKTAQMQLRFW